MVWFTSTVNGNVFEVQDTELARQLEAEGHQVHDVDPRVRKSGKPKGEAK